MIDGHNDVAMWIVDFGFDLDHVGLGSDFDGTPFLPSDLGDVAAFPNLTAELLGRGYAESEIRKILGENLLRVLARAEDLAAR